MKKLIADQKQKMIASTVLALSSAQSKLNNQFTKSALFLKKSVMKTSPSYPLIAFTATQSIKICNNEEDISRIRLSDFQYQTGEQYMFDNHGNKWSFEYQSPPFAVNFWKELINPKYVSPIRYKLKGNYNLPELKENFYSLLEKNDDVLTEHESETFLKTLFQAANSFDEIIAILKKYVFEVNETELWQEQEAREPAC